MPAMLQNPPDVEQYTMRVGPPIFEWPGPTSPGAISWRPAAMSVAGSAMCTESRQPSR